MLVKEEPLKGHATEKLTELTNKKLSESLDLPIARVRRWTKEFLPPDLVATRRSGYSRKFSLNEGFFIYWGGTMVQQYNITYDIVRKMINVIRPWALCNGHVPEIPKGAGRMGVDKNLFKINFNIRTRRLPDKNGIITVVEVDGTSGGKGYQHIDESRRLIEVSEYRTQKYTLEPKFEGFQSWTNMSLPYWSLLNKFNMAIVYDYNAWVNKWIDLNEIEPDTKYEHISLGWVDLYEDTQPFTPMVGELMEPLDFFK